MEGSHFVRKTTYAAFCIAELKRIGVEAKNLEEKSTEAKEWGLPINEGTTLEAQLWILHQQFAEELKYALPRPNGPNYDVLICDRGPGNYCYLKRNLGEDQYALDVVLGHAEKFPYRRIFFFPIVSQKIEKGTGARSLDKEFQLDMEKEVKGFLSKYFKGQLVELPRPAFNDPFCNEWIKIIVNQILQDLGKPKDLLIQ